MDLKDRDSHFEFGQNWQEYSKTIDAARIRSSSMDCGGCFQTA